MDSLYEVGKDVENLKTRLNKLDGKNGAAKPLTSDNFICLYQGEGFSAGAVVQMEGTLKTCMDPGQWAESIAAAVKIETADNWVCQFKNLNYSAGSLVKMDDGKVYECVDPGKWQKKQ